ncbi:hypothetical protein [Glycomyces terrestris]|uniref:Uncharacterized protein n=1 Tax=Glycomyces terrestris TaxID=2493553 RepID=A0A426US37_9ACTN|nr:hypothetical protein [Glycomyces terrestris]RRR96073.1 hypothetical protein EIW28_22685 [Glycomyces terrestris]
MNVYMEVETVRGGGADLRAIAPGARRASDRVKAPAETAAAGNAGFLTGDAGVRWQAALGEVTAGVERRVAWQGEQVGGSADDMEGADAGVGRDFRRIGQRLSKREG